MDFVSLIPDIIWKFFIFVIFIGTIFSSFFKKKKMKNVMWSISPYVIFCITYYISTTYLQKWFSFFIAFLFMGIFTDIFRNRIVKVIE